MKEFFPHSATTREITVRVSVSYLPEQSEPAKGRWFWAYHIRIENEGSDAVQLISREWVISEPTEVDMKVGRSAAPGVTTVRFICRIRACW